MAISFYIFLSVTFIVNPKFIILICLLSLIISFAAINANVLLGKDKVKASNRVNLIQLVITLLSLYVLFNIMGNNSVMAYIYAIYIAYSLSFLLSVFLLKKHSGPELTQEVKWKTTIIAMFSIGFLNQMSHITSLLNARLSYYLLEKYKGVDHLGIYSNGVSLTEAVWMVSGSMAMVQYAHIANSTDKLSSQQLTINLTKISVLLSIIIIIPMILLPSSFYSFIFGKEFININQIMLCLAPGVIFWNFSLLIGHYFSGTGKFYIEFTASSTGLIITLLLSFWAIPLWGFYGAGLISSLSYLANAIVIIYFLKRETGIGIRSLTPTYIDLKSYINSLKSLAFKGIKQ